MVKAPIGWCYHDLLDAASIITSCPRWWYLPWKYPTYRYLVRVMRDSYSFLKRIGYLRPDPQIRCGKRFWFDDRGNLVRSEPIVEAKGVAAGSPK